MNKSIIQKWQEYRGAKKEMLKAASAISKTVFSVEPNVCVNNIVVTGNLNSTTTPVMCEYFRFDKFCDGPNCPMYEENVRYMLLQEKYKKARSEFFNSLGLGRIK